jgi:hypothetical protein
LIWFCTKPGKHQTGKAQEDGRQVLPPIAATGHQGRTAAAEAEEIRHQATKLRQSHDLLGAIKDSPVKWPDCLV